MNKQEWAESLTRTIRDLTRERDQILSEIRHEEYAPPVSDVARIPGRSRTHCPHGHEFTLENTYRTPRNQRMCRICLNGAMRAMRLRKKSIT